MIAEWSSRPRIQLMAAQSAVHQARAAETADIPSLLILARNVAADGTTNAILLEPDTTSVAVGCAIFWIPPQGSFLSLAGGTSLDFCWWDYCLLSLVHWCLSTILRRGSNSMFYNEVLRRVRRRKVQTDGNWGWGYAIHLVICVHTICVHITPSSTFVCSISFKIDELKWFVLTFPKSPPCFQDRSSSTASGCTNL